MKYRIFYPILPFLLITGCFPSGKPLISKAISVQDVTVPGIYYVLPRTSFFIELEAVRTSFIPGPYAPWAEEFLGITAVRTMEEQDWILTGARMISYIEEDPEQTFCISGNLNSGLSQTLEKLEKQNLILLPGTPVYRPSPRYTSSIIDCSPYFTELSYADFIVEKTDTLYKTILEDSVLIRIPVLRRFKETKTEEERAQEAAHYIHKLRKRRAKMVSADYPVLPQGEAMQASINELRKIEEQYLALFLGKNVRDTIRRSFYYTPSTNSNMNQEVVSFSNKEGFLEPGNGIPLTISCDINASLPDSIEINHEKLLASKNSYLYLRLPVTCLSKLYLGENTLLEYRSPIYQKGKLVVAGIFH